MKAAKSISGKRSGSENSEIKAKMAWQQISVSMK